MEIETLTGPLAGLALVLGWLSKLSWDKIAEFYFKKKSLELETVEKTPDIIADFLKTIHLLQDEVESMRMKIREIRVEADKVTEDLRQCKMVLREAGFDTQEIDRRRLNPHG